MAWPNVVDCMASLKIRCRIHAHLAWVDSPGYKQQEHCSRYTRLQQTIYSEIQLYHKAVSEVSQQAHEWSEQAKQNAVELVSRVSGASEQTKRATNRPV